MQHTLHTLSEVMPNLDTADDWWKTILVTIILYAFLVLWARPFRDETKRGMLTLVMILGAGVVAVLPVVGDLGFVIRNMIESAAESLDASVTLSVIAAALVFGAWLLHKKQRTFLTFILLSVAMSLLVATDWGQSIINGWAMICIAIYDGAYSFVTWLYGIRLSVTGI